MIDLSNLNYPEIHVLNSLFGVCYDLELTSEVTSSLIIDLDYRTSELKDALEKARKRSNKEDGEDEDVDNAFDYLDDEESE